MAYSVNKEDIRKIAEDLGLQVSFDSETPGVLNTTTGELTSLSTYFECIYESLENSEEKRITTRKGS